MRTAADICQEIVKIEAAIRPLQVRLGQLLDEMGERVRPATKGRNRRVALVCKLAMEVAAEEFGHSRLELLGRSRHEGLVKGRFTAILLARENLPHASLSELGAEFSRDHASILNALQAVQNRLETEHGFSGRVGVCRQRLGNQLLSC